MKKRTSWAPARWPTLVLGLLLTGCGPSYYLTVRPSDAPDQGHDGHQTLVAELDSVEMVLSYSHQRDQQLLFETEVRNGSSRPIEVDPARFYYQPGLSQGVASVTEGAYFLARVPALDPEAQLQNLTTKLNTEDRKATGTSGWEWLTIINDITSDVTAGKRKETPKEEYERKVQYDRDMRNYDYARAQHAETADRTALEVEIWQRKMLRRYTLQPGELMHGYVVFPCLDQTALLRLSAPVGPHNFTFDFNQQRRKY
jgi:hypothetical protein